LRQAQLERINNQASASRQAMAFLSTFMSVFMKGPGLLKKGKLVEALDLAEAAMEADPTLMSSINFLSRAAQEAKLLNVAVNALEVGSHHNPKNVAALKSLAVVYARAGEDEKALQVRQRICALRPNDLSAQNDLKQATAVAAMKKGKWDQAESFRDVIKDKELAQTLEQQERVAAHDKETLVALIEAAEKAVAEKPTASSHKKLADLYRQNHDLEKALEQYNLVAEKMGAMDPAIDTAITDILCERFDDAIAQWQTFATQNPARQKEAEEKIAAIAKQKDEMVLTRLKERVERYPNDASFRFDLAEAYWRFQDVDLALREFQLAQKSPQLRRKAIIYMGKCLAAKGLHDLAVEQFLKCLEEPTPMDSDRKECLYCLGLAYEAMDKSEDAIKAFKEIFSADVNYRDVSARITAHYKA